MPEISIIVPVYKVEKYLDRCVESILNQTFRDFECILVDDGSPDRSGAMCDEWAKKDARIRVVHKENGGLSNARNAGLEIACGKYIGFVDSDDWIAADMYQKLYTLLQSGNYDFSVCGYRRFSEYTENIENTELEKITIWDRDDYLRRILKVHCQEPNQYACNKLYKKTALKNVTYPEGLTDEDVLGTFRIVLNSANIIETSWVGYAYFYNPDSITCGEFSEKKFDYLKICDLVLEEAKKYGNKEIIDYAKMFRYRADFGVFCRMMISSRDSIAGFYREREQLLREIKKNFLELLKCPMPFSRKALLICIVLNSDFTEKIIRLKKGK